MRKTFDRYSLTLAGVFLLFPANFNAAETPTKGRHDGNTSPRSLSAPAMNSSEKHLSEKITTTGAKFTRVSNDELKQLGVDAEKFGEAWRDPNGMIWGDLIKSQEDVGEAYKICRKIGAKLPTVHDFVRLRKYMGARSDVSLEASISKPVDGYTPQVLPNLDSDDDKNYSPYERNWRGTRCFWSSSEYKVPPGPPIPWPIIYFFCGRGGVIDLAEHNSGGNYVSKTAVRCVISTPAAEGR